MIDKNENVVNCYLPKIKPADIKADIETLIDSVISKENNEEKKYQLLQIKSLLNLEPISSLEIQKPITQKNGFDFDKINFIN